MKNKKLIIFSCIFAALLLFIFLAFTAQKSKNWLVNKIDAKIENKLSIELDQIKFELKKTNLQLGLIRSEKDENFKINKIYFNKKNIMDRPFGYVEEYKNELIFVHGNGDIYFGKKEKKLHETKFFIKDSNIKKFFIFDSEKDSYFNNSVRDIYIFKDNIYVVYIDKIKIKDEYMTTTNVVKSSINKNNLNFKKIFALKERYPESIVHAGGKLQHYSDDTFILAIPDNGYLDGVNSDNFAVGKTVLFKDNDKIFEYEVFTKGHRNPQGLFNDKKNNLIFLTEHGPAGGDEINILKKNLNYGWPKASYGEADQKTFNNHMANGFEEPVHFWKKNPAVSEITKVYKFYNSANDCYFISSLSGASEFFGHHIYVMCGDSSKKFNIKDKIYIGDRIRDIAFIQSHNVVIAVLESSGSLGVISK
jgi:hypothetical protein